MKYSINGFNQFKLLEYGLDPVDALILQWFMSFSGEENIKRYNLNGKSYCWVHYPTVLKEFPTFYLKNGKSISSRFEKYVSLGLLSKEVKKSQKGTLAFFAQNSILKELVYDPQNNFLTEIYALEHSEKENDLFSAKHKELHSSSDSSANSHGSFNGCANSSSDFSTNSYKCENRSIINIKNTHKVNKIKDLEHFVENQTKNEKVLANSISHSSSDSSANSQNRLDGRAHGSLDGYNPITNNPKTTTNLGSSSDNDVLTTKTEVLELVEGILSAFMARVENILVSHGSINGCANSSSDSSANSQNRLDGRAKSNLTETEASEFSFYKNIIKKHYSPESFSNDLWKQLSSFVEKQYLKKEDFEAYIDFVIETVKAKNPKSQINYFYKVVTTPSYATLFYEQYAQQQEQQQKTEQLKKHCVACSTVFNVSEKFCPCCGLDIANEAKTEYITFHKRFALLDESAKAEIDNEISTRNFESFKKHQRSLSAEELQKIYFKYGLKMPV